MNNMYVCVSVCWWELGEKVSFIRMYHPLYKLVQQLKKGEEKNEGIERREVSGLKPL